MLPLCRCEWRWYHLDRLRAHLLCTRRHKLAMEQSSKISDSVASFCDPRLPSSRRTLTDNSVRNCAGDIRTLKPTVMVGVPAVWELIRKGIMAKVKAGGAVKQTVFKWAMAAKRFSGKGGILTGITDAVVFNAVKQGTGGRLKYALSGGAPISEATQSWLSIALCMIIQGYGEWMRCLLTPSFRNGFADSLSPARRNDRVDCVSGGLAPSSTLICTLTATAPL